MSENNYQIAKEEFIKLFPIIPAILTISGIFNTTFYYNRYNIDISSFLDLSEYLTLNLSTTLMTSFVFVVFWMPFIYYFRKSLYELMGILHSGTWQKKLIIFIVCLIVSATLNITVPVYEDYITDKSNQSYIYIPILIQTITYYFMMRLASFIIYNITDKFPTPINVVYNVYILYLILLVVLDSSTYINIALFSTKIKHNAAQYGSFLRTEKDTISIDSSNYLIGKTNNYYFLHNVKQNSNLIIPTSEVKSVNIIPKK